MVNVEELTNEEIEEAVDFLEKKGFHFFVDAHACEEHPYIPDRVKLPDGRILDEKELNTLRKKGSNFNLASASYLFDLCFSEQYGDRRFEHNSFDGDEDFENCKRKYGN